MSTELITEADVAGFREKLARWGPELTEGEQAVLHLVFVRAFPPERDDDVVGYDAKGEQSQGKVQMHDISITKVVDKASPLLVGQPYPHSPVFPSFGVSAPQFGPEV
ncbi:MAG TPA: hypothetical protein VMT43_03850 [Acidimicrobiales bacterium]|nr:hypothetical protein [Acidimicrobiales bacterium]